MILNKIGRVSIDKYFTVTKKRLHFLFLFCFLVISQILEYAGMIRPHFSLLFLAFNTLIGIHLNQNKVGKVNYCDGHGLSQGNSSLCHRTHTQ